VARRVAVTGFGAIAALGEDAPTLWQALREGRCGIRPIVNIPTERLAVRTAAEIPAFDPLRHFEPRRLALLDRCSQLALVAAREAWAMAGLAGAAAPERCGVITAASTGLDTFDASYLALYGQAATRLHPLTVPRIMPNAPGSLISIEFGLRGPGFSIASACASATHAIGLAFQMIRSGAAEVMVTGGGDASLTVGFMKAWDALRVLSPDVCRPFSRDRAGVVLGEGAAIIVLEAWEHARARGAAIQAEVVGFGMSSDANDITAPDAAGAARAMRAALDDAGLPPAAIGYVNAHGTGTRLNDRAETAALRDVFGERLDRLPVSASKSMLGHCLNAGGALECLTTVLALRDGVLPPTINFREPDPECVPDCIADVARAAEVEVALSNSFAFGGLNACLALRRAA
jgi:nodulation protein E